MRRPLGRRPLHFTEHLQIAVYVRAAQVTEWLWVQAGSLYAHRFKRAQPVPIACLREGKMMSKRRTCALWLATVVGGIAGVSEAGLPKTTANHWPPRAWV